MDQKLMGQRLARARAEHKARHGAEGTQRKLAAKLDMDPGTLSRWERGEVVPSVAQLCQLAEIYGASLDWLLLGRQPAVDGGVRAFLDGLVLSWDPETDGGPPPNEEEIAWLLAKWSTADEVRDAFASMLRGRRRLSKTRSYTRRKGGDGKK